jgi:NTP pyrophosphatase (non-canonical NTP hydrolase)
MSDAQTTLAELKELVNTFVEERDWHQFHSPKNLSMSMAIEAAELMEHFQWLTVEQSFRLGEQPEQLAAVGEELADVVCYALAMANELRLDLSTTVCQKLDKNARKYPVEEYRGRFGPGTPMGGPAGQDAER